MSDRRTLQLLPILAVLLVAPAPALAAQQATTAAAPPGVTWPGKLYNPNPAADDLVLPLPCGGAVAFRAVDIPASDLLDDRRVELGHPDPQRGYKEGRRFAHIAGAFDVDDGAARRFYIGKYEITLDQFATLMGEGCPDASMAGRRPVTEISWFDAIEFSRRWTEWLLAEQPSALPRAEQEPGFLRLPTEEEWEFSARGGLKVGDAAFVAPRFPMPAGGLGRYAWHESAASAQGQMNPVGLLEPNPLGLHDILGNAAEMVLTPFQLDHRGRPHGQAGGFVTRGGDIFTPATQLGSASRQEHHLFNADTGRARRREATGFRLVLTAPVIVSAQRLARIKQAWEELPTVAQAADAESAMAALEKLADQMQDADLRRSLQLIRSDLDNAHSAIAEAGNRALGALIRMGAYLGQRVVTTVAHARSIERAMAMGQREVESFADRVGQDPGAPEAIAQVQARLDAKMQQWEETLARVRTDLAGTRDYYADLVVKVARDWKQDAVAGQLAIVTEELNARAQTGMIAYAEAFAEQQRVYRRDGDADARRWQAELVAISGIGDD